LHVEFFLEVVQHLINIPGIASSPQAGQEVETDFLNENIYILCLIPRSCRFLLIRGGHLSRNSSRPIVHLLKNFASPLFFFCLEDVFLQGRKKINPSE
jgi:hypothetical protein